MEILDIWFLLVIANSKPLLFKSPLESLQVEIKFRVYFISSFPWSFSLLLPWVQNQLSNLNRSIPYFFWWLSHPSKKAFHRLQWIILQFAAGTFLIKTFCTNPRSYNFPQIGLPWVCEQNISSETTGQREHKDKPLILQASAKHGLDT